jgi:hypothetical protein
MIADSKNKLNKVSPAEILKSDIYDYLIVGPHPHNVKGKNGKHNWQTFASVKKLSVKVFQDYDKPISKDQFLIYTKTIGEEFNPIISDCNKISTNAV